jgi:phosphoserine phosphatase
VSGLPKSDLAIFDLCDTLYAENTTRGFVRFFLKRRRAGLRQALIGLVYSRRLPVFYLLAALHRYLSFDLYRRALVRALRGYRREDLADAARAYAAEHLPAIEIAETQARLAEHLGAGDRVVIVSNSLDMVVEAVAERLGIEGHGSRMAYTWGRCDGWIEADLTGRKAEILAELVAERPAQAVHAYTDNLSDRDLLQAADRRTIIVPAGRTRERWGDIDAVFIEL